MKPVVLDTSVVVAGFLSARGSPGALLEAFFADRLQLAFSGEMLAEYAEVLARPKFAAVITPADRAAFILKLHVAGFRVEPAAVPRAKWPDPDDVPFVAAALATESKIIVTLNPRDFAPAAAIGVRILSPTVARAEVL